MKRYLRVFTLGLIILAALGAANTVWGVTISTNLPGLAPSTDPGGFVANFYQFALMVGGILAFGAIVYGGVKYTFARGDPPGMSEGKEWVKGALLGLLLLVGAYIILNTINPDIVSLKLPPLPTVSVSAPPQTQICGAIIGGNSQGGSCPDGKTCRPDSNGIYSCVIGGGNGPYVLCHLTDKLDAYNNVSDCQTAANGYDAALRLVCKPGNSC